VVATLADEYKQPGVYQAEFNAAKLPTGMYLFELKAGDYREVRKMTLIK